MKDYSARVRFASELFPLAFNNLLPATEATKRRKLKSGLDWFAARKDGLHERVKIQIDFVAQRGYVILFQFGVCCFPECPMMNTAFGRTGTLNDFPGVLPALAPVYFSSGWFIIGPKLEISTATIGRLIDVNESLASRHLDLWASSILSDELVMAACALFRSYQKSSKGVALDTIHRELGEFSGATAHGYPVPKVARQLYAKLIGEKEWYSA